MKKQLERNRVELRRGVLILHQAPGASWRQQEKNAAELLRVFARNGKKVKKVWVEVPDRKAHS
jgi:hypothetical protein